MPRTIAIDTETTGLFIHKGCKPFTISACTDDGKIYLWKFKVDPYTRDVRYPPNKIRDFKNTVSQFDEVIFHHANFDLQALEPCGIPYSWFFDNFEVHDTWLMSHAYKSDNKHGLKDLAITMLGYPDHDERILSEIVKKARNEAKKLEWTYADKNNLHESLVGTQKEHFRCDYWIPAQIAAELGYAPNHQWYTICDKYAGQDAERTIALFFVLKDLLQSEEWRPSRTVRKSLYDAYDNARKLIYPILDMETSGVTVKPKALREAKTEYTAKRDKSLHTLRRLANDPNFNPRSPKQLPLLLFQKFGFAPKKMGKAGPSTDKHVISALMQEPALTRALTSKKRIPPKYEFLVTLKEHRKETATLQYIENYDKHSLSGKVPLQPLFSQAKTGTTRLACENPNTTNVGKKNMANPFAEDKDPILASQLSSILGIDEESSFSLRNVFGPARGKQWTCIDYQQFQLRIFAVVSESHALLEAFAKGLDVHDTVAKIIFNTQDISSVQRTAAKAINFGILFGAGPSKIELLAGIPGLYKMFTDNFPKAKVYLDTQQRLAERKGYIHTVNGYRLYVPRKRAYAASCYVIQGTEAQIVRNAMVRVHKQSTVHNLIMMVHDELVFESVRGNTPRHRKSLNKIMSTMVECSEEMNIPAAVDAKVTTTDWASCIAL